jgi:hypothetical protein
VTNLRVVLEADPNELGEMASAIAKVKQFGVCGLCCVLTATPIEEGAQSTKLNLDTGLATHPELNHRDLAAVYMALVAIFETEMIPHWKQKAAELAKAQGAKAATGGEQRAEGG